MQMPDLKSMAELNDLTNVYYWQQMIMIIIALKMLVNWLRKSTVIRVIKVIKVIW